VNKISNVADEWELSTRWGNCDNRTHVFDACNIMTILILILRSIISGADTGFLISGGADLEKKLGVTKNILNYSFNWNVKLDNKYIHSNIK